MERMTIPDVMVDEKTKRRTIIDASEVRKYAMEFYWRLKTIEDILGDDYDLDRIRRLVEADREGKCHIGRCVECTHYKGLATCEYLGECGGTNWICGWFDRREDVKDPEKRGLEIFYKNVSSVTNCNTCARATCQYRPLPGQQTRFNCPLWANIEEGTRSEDQT